MRVKLLFAGLTALAVIVPATIQAGPVTGADKANGARACSTLRTSLGPATFGLTYGTNASRSNAYGKCVSQWAQSVHQARHNAEAACRAEQQDPNFAASHGGKTFDQFYGTGKGKNAFGKCVAGKASAKTAVLVQATRNAAQQCKAERSSIGAAAFAAKYGTNANKRNAFGKCVSSKVSKSTQTPTTHYSVVLAALNGSGVTGTATLSLKNDQLTVTIEAAGLEAGKEHMQHVHGLESGNATCPTAAQADSNKDGVITLAEGQPYFGAVLVSLTPFPTASSTGSVSYTQTLTVDRAKLLPLENRTIVLHGKTVGGSYDATLPVACGEIVSK